MLTTFPSPEIRSRHPVIPQKPSSPEITRLLTAAVINRRFRELLLQDPARALNEGFQGEYFFLSSREQDLVLSIKAVDLGDYASQVSAGLENSIPASSGAWAPVNQPALMMNAE